MEWKDFLQLPIHIQKEYLENIIETYSATATDLAKMFGVTARTVLGVCNNDGIGVKFSRGKRMSSQQREKFNAFLGIKTEGYEPPAEDESIPAPDVSESNEDDNSQVDINIGELSKRMAMSKFSLDFCGKFDRDMIYNSISSMLPVGTDVHIEVRCEILT